MNPNSLAILAIAFEWDFEPRSISPDFQQWNGLVESAIQTVKHTLKKQNKQIKTIIYQYCFWTPNLTEMDYH